MSTVEETQAKLKKTERENIILTDLWNTTQRLVLQHQEAAQVENEPMIDDILAELNTI